MLRYYRMQLSPETKERWRKEGLLESAKAMYREGLSADLIKKVTGLSVSNLEETHENIS